jgi:HEAT repeat protein
MTRPLTRKELLAKYPNHLALIDGGEIPQTEERTPDLSYLTESAQFYYDLICDSAPHLKDKPRAVTWEEKLIAGTAYGRMVNASWGLIARGAESIPFAIRLVRSKDRDEKEMGANVFCGFQMGERAPEVLQHVIAALEHETDRLVIDSLIGALGHLRSRDAIPVLAKFIRNDQEDGDTRWEAAVSLGKIVHKRFAKDGQNAIENAMAWLNQNENTA